MFIFMEVVYVELLYKWRDIGVFEILFVYLLENVIGGCLS